jgi:hypothetical protein
MRNSLNTIANLKARKEEITAKEENLFKFWTDEKNMFNIKNRKI